MAQTDRYTVIMPTYNERENMPVMLFLLFEVAEKSKIDLEVVVVDDASPDKTGDLCESIIKVYGADKVKLLRRKAKLGLGSAYIEGSKIATGNHIILMDADLSHHPRYIPQFIQYD